MKLDDLVADQIRRRLARNDDDSLFILGRDLALKQAERLAEGAEGKVVRLDDYRVKT